MGLVIKIDLIEEGIHVGVGTVENKRLVELDMTLEDGAVFIKDPDKFKEFKKTREEEMVEEDKLRTESKKTVYVSDLVRTDNADINEENLRKAFPRRKKKGRNK